MKDLMKVLLCLSILCVSESVYAQIKINKPEKVIERQAESRANRKIDQVVNSGFDAVESGIGSLFKKKKKDKTSKEEEEEQKDADVSKANQAKTQSNDEKTEKGSKPKLTSYSKFDFIPGAKVLAVENFSQAAIGDFPVKWNTNSSAEIVTIDGTEGKWLMLGPEGVYYPEFIGKLPENFTFEFDLASTSSFSFYSGMLRTIIAAVPDVSRGFTNWKQFGVKSNGLEIGLHPNSAGGTKGRSSLEIFAETRGKSVMNNKKDFPTFRVPEHNLVRVAVWRQKERLRIYVDDFKVWDIPRAFQPDTQYNFIGFSSGTYHNGDDRYFISGLRLAVGAPDTRGKLITEGKFSTTGILFDVNSATIRPESYGVLKDISAVLTENPTVKVKIVGHTDSDGDDTSNLALSKKRSEAVKTALSENFAIDEARMETDGKGETEAAFPNDTPEGKANNRRVEFIKI